jgi:Putative motility protein
MTMTIASNSGVSAATSAAQEKGAGAVQIKVLKKALDAQAATAATLIQSLPQQPALATSGSVGTKLNTYA